LSSSNNRTKGKSIERQQKKVGIRGEKRKEKWKKDRKKKEKEKKNYSVEA